MKTLTLSRLAAVLLATAVCTLGQEAPQMPQPTKEHEWLKQFAGTWDYDVEIFMQPGQPPLKAKGTEVARMIGGFWVIGESKGDLSGMTFTNITTFGYDPAKKKYVGTAIDSASSTLWRYEGTGDATGKMLTFETEGPCPMRGGRMTKFKQVVEWKSENHRVFTSSAQEEDGKWTVNVIVNSRRKS